MDLTNFREVLLYIFFSLKLKTLRKVTFLGAAQQRANKGAGEGLHRQGKRPSPHGYQWQDKC